LQEEGDGIQEIVAVEETKKPAQVMKETKEKTSVMDQGQPDRHPEKRRKAAYRQFEEEKMIELRKEFPTLKLS
jgi:hypothetical protein